MNSDSTNRRLILHVGFHKTGTTAIQESLYSARKDLLSLGLVYPNMGKKAHHPLARALIEVQKEKNDFSKALKLHPLKKLIKQVKNTEAGTLVLSSEFFSQLQRNAIEFMHEQFSGWKVDIVFTLRSLMKILPSAYQQYLKSGLSLHYEEWLEQIFYTEFSSKITPTFWKRHNHQAVIRRWCDVFTEGNVSIIIANENRKNLLYQAFSEIMKIDEGTLQEQPIGSNRSLDLGEIALLVEINKICAEKFSKEFYLSRVRNGMIRYLTDQIVPDSKSSKLLTPEWALAKANILSIETKNMISESRIKVYGNLADLSDEQNLVGTSVYPKTVSIKKASRIISYAYESSTTQCNSVDKKQKFTIGRMLHD